MSVSDEWSELAHKQQALIAELRAELAAKDAEIARLMTVESDYVKRTDVLLDRSEEAQDALTAERDALKAALEEIERKSLCDCPSLPHGERCAPHIAGEALAKLAGKGG